jgi:YD repeat-containing protein
MSRNGITGRGRRRRRPRLTLEVLEDRTLPSTHQTLATALGLSFHNNQATVSGYLASPSEADLFRVSLAAGEVVTARVSAQDTGSALDSALRVFDGGGRPIALNNDFNGRDPELTFQAAKTGTYFVGVSAVGNTDYNPGVQDSGTGQSAGLYALSLTRLATQAPLEPDLVGATFRVSADTALWGDKLAVSYTIENRGGADAGAFDSAVLLSTDSGFATTTLTLGSIHLDGLARGSAVGGTLTVTLPGAPGNPPANFPEPGTVYLGLQVDAGATTVAQAHAGHNGSWRQGMNAAALDILQQQTAALPNGPAVVLGMESSFTGQLGGNDTATYQLNVSASGRLIARVHAEGVATRLALYDDQGHLLVQSDGQAPGIIDDLIDQHLDPTGTAVGYYLKVTALPGGSGTYTLSSVYQPSLTPTQPISVGQFPTFVLQADLNGDGIPDLAVADFGTSDVRLFLGNGDGTFRPGQTLTLPGQAFAWSVVAGDFNGDGQPDLAVAFNESLDQLATFAATVEVFLGDGDGNFQAGQVLTVGDNKNDTSYEDRMSVVAADFNRDGRTDLAVVDGDSGAVHIFLGNGDGTFNAGRSLSVGSLPNFLAAGDFNGDGQPDLAVADGGSGDVRVLLGQGDGTFRMGQVIRFASGSYPSSLTTADFNADGHADLAVVDLQNGAVHVLLGQGDGTFRMGPTVAVGSQSYCLVSGDFNGDGRADLAVADAGSDDVRVLLGNGDGSFRPGETLSAGIPFAVATGDFTGTGRMDLAVADTFSQTVQLFFGNGDGTFRADQPLTVGAYPVTQVAGDFNGDGRADLVISDSGFGGGDDVRLLLGKGDGAFQTSQTLLPFSPNQVVDGDFNGDGRADLAYAAYNAGGYQVGVLLGNGDGTFTSGPTLKISGDPLGLVAGDFNGDGATDLAVDEVGTYDPSTGKYDGPDAVGILLSNGNGTFRAGQIIIDPNLSDLVAADFNGDGRTDLVIQDAGPVDSKGNPTGPGDVRVLLGQADGTLRSGQTFSLTGSVVTGDFNGDGIPDLAVFDGSSALSLLLGNGDGTFRAGAVASLPAGSFRFRPVAGDFNGDGLTDVAVMEGGSAGFAGGGTGFGFVDVLLNNGDGTFRLARTTALEGLTGIPLAADFNGDGRTDLAVAEDPGQIQVLLSNGDGTFSTPSDQAPDPAPSRPFLVDLNGDGTPDLIVRQQSGAVLFRPGVPGSPAVFGSPVTVNPHAPAQDLAVVRTPLGNRLAALSASGTSVMIFAAASGDTFGVVQTLAVPGGTGSRIAAGAVDGGRFDDLAVSVGNQVLVYRQQPGGSFSGPDYQLTAEAPPSDIRFADLTGSGLAGIIAPVPSTGVVNVFHNDSVQPFSSAERLRGGSGPYDLASEGATVQSLDGTSLVLPGRFDEADAIDLLALNRTSATVSVLRGTGVAGGFGNSQVVLALGFPATEMAASDFNRDGHLDLAFLDAQDDLVVIYVGDGTGHLTRAFSIGAGHSPSGLSVADVNGDGIPDLLVGSATGDVLILLGKGDGTFRPAFLRSERNLALASFTGSDGTVYFVSANQAQNRVTVQDAGGNTTFTADVSSGLDGPSAVAVADLNGDGLPDLLVANSSSNELLVFLGTGQGQFAATPLAFPAGTNLAGITVADLARKGIPDVVVANEGSNTLSVLFGQGHGTSWTLVGGPQLATGPGPVATVVADVTGPEGKPDGIPDIIVSNSQGDSISVLRGLGSGYFADNQPVTILTGPRGLDPGPLFLGHFGGPGLDLVTLDLRSNTLSYFANFPRRLLTAAGPSRTLSSGGRNPVAAVTGDLAGGYRELIVANASGTLAVFDGTPDGLTLARTVQVPLSDITALALGSGGTVLVGGLGGVVTLPLAPASLEAVVTAAVSALPLGPAFTQESTAAPTGSASTTVAALSSPPPVGQTSGTAGLGEASGPGGALSGADFDPLGGTATDAAISLGSALDLAPESVAAGPAVPEEVAASLLTGGKPAARLLPQKGGTSVAPVPSLTIEEGDDSGKPAETDEESSPPRMMGFGYTDVLTPPRPERGANHMPAGGLPARGQTRLGASTRDEDWPWVPGEAATEALALALLMSGGLDVRRRKAGGSPRGEPDA